MTIKPLVVILATSLMLINTKVLGMLLNFHDMLMVMLALIIVD